MKLRISNAIPKADREIYAKAFPIITVLLGINQYDGVIELYYEAIKDEVRRIRPNILERITNNAYLKPHPDFPLPHLKPLKHFQMVINSLNPRLERLESFGHEMVHVKQHVLGELLMDQINERHLFHNIPMPHDMDYDQKPWEIEAHKRQEGIAKRVILKLSHQEQKWLLEDRG